MFLHPVHNPVAFLDLDLGYGEALQLLELHTPCNLSHGAVHVDTQVLEPRKGSRNVMESVQLKQP